MPSETTISRGVEVQYKLPECDIHTYIWCMQSWGRPIGKAGKPQLQPASGYMANGIHYGAHAVSLENIRNTYRIHP